MVPPRTRWASSPWLRCISNWLVVAMERLRHPHPEHSGGQQLVQMYGPRVKFERHPHPEHGGGQQLVRMYGPRVKFERHPHAEHGYGHSS